MSGGDEASSTTGDRIVAEIREQILSGELNPGDRLLTVPDLAARFEVSLNTARQALAILASHGLLDVRRGVSGGSFVTVPGHDQIRGSWQTNLSLLTENEHLPLSALLEMREVLEVPAAEMAALRRTDEDLSAISASLFDPDDVDTATVRASNLDFHTAILRATHNPLFELVAEPVRRVLRDRLSRDHVAAEFWRKVDGDHREILGYLRASDQAGAREAARAHLRSLRSTYERV